MLARRQPLPGPRVRAAAPRRCRDRYGIPPERIAIGNGSCDILLAAGEALLEPGAEVVYAWPSFSVYPHLAAATGARAIEVPLDDDDRHDLDAMRRRDHGRHAPGDRLQPEQPHVDRGAAGRDRGVRSTAVPRHVCVILDEAYCEFALRLGDPDASLDLLRRHPNLVLLRTFSKVYGLAGLRVGYALCGVGGVPHRRRPGAPAVLLQRRRAGRRGRGARAPGRGRRAASTQTIAARLDARGGTRASSGCAVAESAGELHLAAPARGLRRGRRWSTGCAERGVLVRAGAALGREGALRVTSAPRPRTTGSWGRWASSCSCVMTMAAIAPSAHEAGTALRSPQPLIQPRVR